MRILGKERASEAEDRRYKCPDWWTGRKSARLDQEPSEGTRNQRGGDKEPEGAARRDTVWALAFTLRWQVMIRGL